MFAVPVWALYLVWVHRGPRLAVPAALGLVIPLLAYASWHAADTGRFGLTQADGWPVSENGLLPGVEIFPVSRWML